MTNERETFFQPLTLVDYDIAGNSFRAYYDADKKLVFVIDFLINDIKPNVLLVINPVGDRKWDDILENDYGVDLETVRPKKDNKYQKLDVEYAGLAQYDDLIRAYEYDTALNEPLRALVDFRNVAAKRAAIERLGAAELTASRSRETIDKTNDKIEALQARIKTLRQKLTDAKRAIGKEPPKQSAAKVLRLESQIDSTNEKLKRAKKRLSNAQHRLAAAEDEIEVAQYIIDKLNVNLPASPVAADVVVAKAAPVPAEITNNLKPEPKAEDMADEEVKPLFDTDPNIIDEEIAFKPIDFNTPAVMPEPVMPVINVTQNVTPVVQTSEESTPAPVVEEEVSPFAPVPVFEEVAPVAPIVEPIEIPTTDIAEEQETFVQPLSFTPPTEFKPDDVQVDVQEEIEPTPIFEGFTPIPLTEQQTDEIWKNPGGLAQIDKPVQDVLEPVVGPEYKPDECKSDEAKTDEDIVVAPVESDFRPVSPITNEAPAAVAPVGAPVQSGGKPTMLYYVLLIVLIVLSVFTLWFYQKSANDTMPELGAKTEPVVVEEVVEQQTVEEPVVVPEPIEVEPVALEPVVIPEIEPTVVDVTEPVVESVVEAETVPVTEPETEPDVVTDVVTEDTDNASPFIELETLGPVIGPMVETPVEEQVTIPTEEEILASKPAYGTTSKSDDMFVAAPEYETETVVTEPVVEVAEPIVEIDEPAVVTEYDEEEYFVEEETCSDGNPPDMYGCCTGEDFVLLPDGEKACCAESTGECFPPM